MTTLEDAWKEQEGWAVDDADSLCLLDLRRRVEALEQRATPAAVRPLDDPLEPFTLEELDGLADWLAARHPAYTAAANALRAEARRAREGA